MAKKRTKVSLRHWKTCNEALQKALRDGDIVDAKRQAHTLLSYLGEMGLLDELDRQGVIVSGRDICNGMVNKEKARMSDTA